MLASAHGMLAWAHGMLALAHGMLAWARGMLALALAHDDTPEHEQVHDIWALGRGSQV